MASSATQSRTATKRMRLRISTAPKRALVKEIPEREVKRVTKVKRGK